MCGKDEISTILSILNFFTSVRDRRQINFVTLNGLFPLRGGGGLKKSVKKFISVTKIYLSPILIVTDRQKTKTDKIPK